MDTLRRHVTAVHGRYAECGWGKCATQNSRPQLLTTAEFEEHMEDAHLTPYQWHMGDGCQNTFAAPHDDSKNMPPYLLDKNGNQVTPSIRGQELEDLVTYRENRRRLRQMLAQRDANAPFEDEEEPVNESLT